MGPRVTASGQRTLLAAPMWAQVWSAKRPVGLGSMWALRGGGAGLWVWVKVSHMPFALQGHLHLSELCWRRKQGGLNTIKIAPKLILPLISGLKPDCSKFSVIPTLLI